MSTFHMGVTPPAKLSLGSLSNDHGDVNENANKAIGLDWQNNNIARASRSIVHVLALTARYDVKMANFTCSGEHEHKTTTLVFFS